MRSLEREQKGTLSKRCLSARAKAALVFGCGVSATWLSAIAEVRAQTVAEPVTRQEVVQEEIAGPQPQAQLPLYVLPPQSNMREVKWGDLTGWDNSQIPAFFRD